MPRTRLLAKVDSAAARGVAVTLVSAPAGAGKTMLLAQCWRWVHQRGDAVAWLSLDDYDNDPFVMWSGILRACGRAVRGLDPPAEVRLGALRPPSEAGNSGFLTAFFDALSSLPGTLWIILDDVHVITSAAGLATLAALIRTEDPHVRFMLGSRFDPPLLTARMVMDGQAWDLRAADLAFDHAEADQLLRSHAIDVSERDLALLLARTEGWAAGLRLAALSMASQDDVGAYIADFAGDDRPLSDYLVAEVLTALSDDTVDLLLATSVAETLTPELASKLSGRQDAGAVLARLARDNALVYRVGPAPTAYRLHGLLRGYLLAEGSRRNADAQRLHHIKASEWFAEHRLPALALDHAAQGGDWQRVVDLIDTHGLQLLLAGDGSSLCRIVDLLPEGWLARPGTTLIAALAALESGALASARRLIDHVGRRPEVHSDRRLQLLHTTALLYEARLRGDRSDRLAELIALSDVPVSGESDLALLAAVNRGILRIWLMEFQRANADLEAALRMARRDARDALALECISYLAVCAAALGDFDAVERRGDEAVELASQRGWSATARMAPVYLLAAGAAWQRLDSEAAAKYVSLVSTIDADLEPEVELSARLLDASIAFETGTNRRDAVRNMRQAWPHDKPQLLPVSIAYFCLNELQMALSVGDGFATAEVVARAERLLGETGDTFVMRALVHAHHGRKAAARNVLAPVLSGAATCVVVNCEITAWLLAAHFAAESDEPARAHDALLQALDLAAPRRMYRELMAASSRVKSLLVRGEGRFGEHKKFVGGFLAAATATRGADILPTVSGEALTARELDVLRDLPSLLSLEEIAAAHVLSVNTVKTHLKAIYRKFDVSNRRQAVDRARELGLL
ncbi:helix-turn-helix transcriptional regulator [Jiangella aurantiaca]|uniref:helix-turn-helix transcriptional regulator n=1 Tax=Jiangella aurantiaca TaxID=2530373 RepID=UPI0013A5E6D4|nr:LuxR C-terminal-related transcriptional regulator [Jiangella aurantiaca]